MRRATLISLMVGFFWAFAAAQVPPEVPPTLTFDSQAVLHWEVVPGAVGYNVYRGQQADGSDLACLAFNIPAPQFADPLVPPAGLLEYVVAAWGPGGEGPLGSGTDGRPRIPRIRCGDQDGDGVRDDFDNCPGLSNPDQADQNADGMGDLCDLKTYHFENDLPGQRPAGMTQCGGTDATFLVRDFGGDRGVSYDGGGGLADAFDRLDLWFPFQGLTVYLDTAELAGEAQDLMLWNEGTHIENAGSGLWLRLDGTGNAEAFTRFGQVFTSLGKTALSGATRLRLRVLKGVGTESTIHLDSWNGTVWTIDAGVFSITDDTQLWGRKLALSNLANGRKPLLRVTAERAAAEAALVIDKSYDRLDDWKLFQRGPDGAAPLPLTFSYRAAEPVRLEARLQLSEDGALVPGFDFGDHQWSLPAAPQGAAQELVLDQVPQGGNYDLLLRLVRAADGGLLGQEQVTQLAVGDVFLAAGQSNMSGYSGSLDPAEPPVPQVHTFGNDYRWKQAKEPMDDGTQQVDRVSVDAPAHSLMLRFAKEISAGAGVPVAVIPAPLGGTNLYSQWQRQAADPDNRGTLYGSSIYRILVQGYAHPIRGVIWYQGESDAGRGIAAYRQDLKNLVANFRADLGNPQLFFGNCQLATWNDSTYQTWMEIQEAQREYALTDPQSVVIAILDQPRADSIHLTVQGYKEAGRRLAMAVLHGSYGLETILGPQLQSVRLGAGKNTVELTYDKPVTGGASYLYQVTQDGSNVGISGMEVVGRKAILKLFYPVNASKTRVSYGFSRSPSANWLRGSDGAGVALAFLSVAVTP